MKSPEEAGQKWLRNIRTAGESVRSGVQAVTEAPGARAAQNAAGYLNGVQNNVDKWRANVGSVSLNSWRDSMLTLGVPRMAQGAEKNVSKTVAALRQIIPHVEAGKEALKATPRGDYSANIQRMNQFIEHMHQLKVRRG